MACTLLCIAVASLGATLGFLVSGLCIAWPLPLRGREYGGDRY
jgi:hypothetical protein